MKALRDEVEANEAFMHILLNFLKEDNAELSPLVVSFYTGLISSLIQFHSDGTFEPVRGDFNLGDRDQVTTDTICSYFWVNKLATFPLKPFCNIF